MTLNKYKHKTKASELEKKMIFQMLIEQLQNMKRSGF